jgi:hypothetical protein
MVAGPTSGAKMQFSVRILFSAFTRADISSCVGFGFAGLGFRLSANALSLLHSSFLSEIGVIPIWQPLTKRAAEINNTIFIFLTF